MIKEGLAKEEELVSKKHEESEKETEQNVE